MTRAAGHLGDSQAQQKLAQLERKRAAQELGDLERVLGLPEGRRFFYRLVFGVCDVMGPSWNGAIKDGVMAGMVMAHHEGLRAAGASFVTVAQTNFPALWVMMIQEQLAQLAADAEERQKAGENDVR